MSQAAPLKEKPHASSNIIGHSDLFNLLRNHSAEEPSHANLQRGQRFCIFQPRSQFEMDGSSSNTSLLRKNGSLYLLTCMHTAAYTHATSYSFFVFNELPMPSCFFNRSGEFPLKHDSGRKVIQNQNDPIILEHFMNMPIPDLPLLIVDRESIHCFMFKTQMAPFLTWLLWYPKFLNHFASGTHFVARTWQNWTVRGNVSHETCLIEAFRASLQPRGNDLTHIDPSRTRFCQQ